MTEATMLYPVLHVKTVGEADIMRSDQVREILSEEGRASFVGPSSLVGIRLLCVRLEYEHFPPHTEENEDLSLYLVSWADTHWIVISVPSEAKAQAEKIAGEVGLSVEEGCPVLYTEGDLENVQDIFPLAGRNMSMIVFPGDRERTKRKDKIERAYARENVEIDRIINQYREKHGNDTNENAG